MAIASLSQMNFMDMIKVNKMGFDMLWDIPKGELRMTSKVYAKKKNEIMTIATKRKLDIDVSVDRYNRRTLSFHPKGGLFIVNRELKRV